MATHYVSSSGSASWANSTNSATPCSLATANSNAAAGDIVNLRAGTYTTNLMPANSGSAGNFITFQSYPGETATIQNQTYNLAISGKSYIKVSGITFVNPSDYWGAYVANGATYNWITGCTFHTNTSGGPFRLGTEDTVDATQYNLIEGCSFYHGLHHACALLSQNNTFRNNLLHNEDWSPYGGRVLYCMGVTGGTSGIRNIVEGNRIGYAGQTDDGSYAHGVLLASHYYIVRYNTLLRNKGDGFKLYTSSGYPVAPSYNHIFNNTIYDTGVESGYYGVVLQDAGNAGTITGNIFKNNLYYSNDYGNYGSWNGDWWPGQTRDHEFITGNPLFFSETGTDPASLTSPNLHIQAGSPAIGYGTSLTTVSSVSDQTHITVADAGYFQDGTFAPSGTSSADWIAIGTVGNIAKISSINYSTGQITLVAAPNTTITAGNAVWLYQKSDGVKVLYRSAPDAGAEPYVLTCTPAQLSATYAGASTGDTIYVGSGSVSWSTTLAKRCAIIGGGIGPGQTPGTTTINGQVTFAPTMPDDSILLRLSGVTIQNSGTGMDNSCVFWGSTSGNTHLGSAVPKNARLDHAILVGPTTTMRVSDDLYGVVDHVTFGSSGSPVYAGVYNQSVYYCNAFLTSPQSVYSPGMQGNGGSVVFEDCIFYVSGPDYRMAGHNIGGRTCFRYCTIHLASGSQGWIDIHGCQDSTYWPGAWGVEVYGCYCPTGTSGKIADVRSGQNMMFWNAASGLSNATQNYWGTLMSCPSSYAPNEECIHDAYYWNNRSGPTGGIAASYTGTTGSCGGLSNRPLAGRDYFDDVSTTPTITSGTLANRPTATAVGQGYWATDQASGMTNLTDYVGDNATYPSRLKITGTFYKCTSVGVWTEWYSPYTYPHPLVSSQVIIPTGGASTPPVGSVTLSVR
jgi:hypothetical protein